MFFRSSRDEESDDELTVMIPSDNLSRRHISVGSTSSASTEASVVDLTNDSGLEDEDVIDLTASFQVSMHVIISVSFVCEVYCV